MISTKFIKSSFLITIGNALPLLSGIVLLPFYINVLSTELFAELAIYVSITLLAQLFFGFGFEAYMNVAPIKYKNEPVLLKSGVSSLFTITLFIGIGLILISYFFGNFIFEKVFDSQFSFFPFGFLSIITAFFNNFFKIQNNYLLSQQKVNHYFMANFVNFSATLILSLIGLFYFGNSLWGPILGRLLSGLVIFIMSLIAFIKEFKFKLNIEFLKIGFQFAFPFLIFLIFNWAMNYYDRIIIENNMELSDLAMYDFATKCCLPLEFLQNGLFAAISPLIYKIWRDGNINYSTQEVNRYFNGYSAIFLILVPLSSLLIPLVVPLVIHKTIYFESFKYIGIMTVGYCFKAYYFVYYIVILYNNKTKVMPLVFLILGSLQICLMLISAKYFGLMGIILSTLLVKIIQPFVISLFAKTEFTYNYNKFKIIFLPLIFLVVVLLSQYFMDRISFYVVYSFQLLFAITFVYFVYKNELLFIMNKYLKK